MDSKTQPEPASPPNPGDDLLARALRRVGRRAGAAVGGATLVGAALPLPTLAGCIVDDPTLGQAEQQSWADDEGQRSTEMVRFTGEHWTSCRYPNTRFGCGSLDIYLKLRVKPVAGVDLAWKKVGVVYHTVGDAAERTAVGYYSTTWADGFEEWHVPVTVYANAATVVFDAWYQDGAGHTYYDDNQGESHVANTGAGASVVRVEPWRSSVVVDGAGVRGTLSLQVADLDYDKQIALIGTTDDWQTSFELGQGAAGDANRWHWVEDFPWSNFERWEIALDLPCAASVTRFQYAVVYRHGIVDGATTYPFWDNNWGQNYVVERAP